MATAANLAGRGRIGAFDSIAASANDSVLVAAVPGKKIRVLSAAINHGDTTASAVTFKTKPTGASSALTPAYKGAANGLLVFPETPSGWFETRAGDDLTVTTGAGSTTGVNVVYELVAG